ncbi:MAG: hypothetical protein J6X66_02475, partial [Lachnospiraceae bacterium]|nr:hypothetical protein [Lachnospiraceae bacterium]
MRKKQTIRRILSFILSLTLVMGDIPVLPTVITANAGSEEEAVISEDAVSEDAVSDDTANPEDETVSDNEAVTDDTIEPEDDIKENYTEDTNDSDEISIPSGGIITMPWDIDVPAADDSLTIADIDEMVEGEAVPVEEIRADNSDRSSEPGDDHDYDGSAIRIVSLDSEIVGSVAPALNENAGSAYPAAYTDTTTINGHLAKISPTRNQNPFGTCWAHASIALAELYSIVNQGKNASDVNYSERHLAYYTYAQGTPLTNSNGEILINNPGDSITGNVPEWYILDKGGNVGDAAQNLMRWRGVVAENTVPYPSSDQISGNKHNMLDYSYTATIEYADVVRLENCYVINIKSNPEIVKRYIKAYGGAAISYYHPGDAIQGTTNANYQQYVNPETSAFYYDGNITTTNHAVTIVGWDDNYPAANFNSGHRPEHNGAWLVRNSWISEYSSLNSVDNYNGYFTYFWMSYDNKSMSDSAYVYKLQDDDKWL